MKLKHRRKEILRGRPLLSRTKWLMIPLGYVAFLVAALVVSLLFVDGFWLAVALTILALAASIVPEMVVDLRYSRYREEWEAANKPDSYTE